MWEAIPRARRRAFTVDEPVELAEAVMVASPTVRAVTTPPESTLAFEVSLEVHENVYPDTSSPSLSTTLAV